MKETLRDCFQKIYVKLFNDPERDRILERLPLVLGLGIYIGLQKFAATLPKHLTRPVTRKGALRYIQDIYVDLQGLNNLSEIFVEQSLTRFFDDASFPQTPLAPEETQ